MLDAIYRIQNRLSLWLPFSTPNAVKHNLDKLENMIKKIGPYIPFTGTNTTRRSLSRISHATVLDVGCGKGEHPAIKFIQSKGNFIVGLDIFPPYLRECKKRGIYTEYVLADVKKIPFKEKSFDVVLCFELLEHLEKEEGWQLLQDVQQLARKKVIISTPCRFEKQEAYDGNPAQEHKSFWYPAELRRFGFKVRGYGLLALVQKGDVLHPLWRIFNFSYILISPLLFLFPELAGHMIAVKNIEPDLPGKEDMER